MSLNELCGYYDSYERNLVKEFYIPLFKSATIVNRVSCYFSSKALALYATGLEEFALTWCKPIPTPAAVRTRE